MQRKTHNNDSSLCIGNLTIDTTSKSAKKDGNRINVTWAEFDLLWYLSKNSGRVVSRDELFEQLLGMEYNGLNRTLDVRVSRLRRKLKSDPDLSIVIQTVRSEGYCLIVNPELESSNKN